MADRRTARSTATRRAACLAVSYTVCVSSVAAPTGCQPKAESLPPPRDMKTLLDAPLYTFSEGDLDAYLKDMARRKMTVPQRVAHFAAKAIGQPYQLYLLGEGGHEPYDTDPLYCLFAGDCVTFVEHIYAMAMSHDWDSFLKTLMRLRYRDGRIGMLTRNHFTEADWNVNNAWAFDDVTDRVAPGDVRPMRVAVDRAAFFKKHGIGGDIPVEVFKTSYIPRAALSRVESRLLTGDIVEFVRGKTDAPYVGHMGLIGERKAGRVMLIHSAEPRARDEPLADYIGASAKILGIKVLRYRGDEGGQ